VLLVVPALYMIVEDFRAWMGMGDENEVKEEEEEGAAPPEWQPAQVDEGGQEAPRIPPAE